MSSSSSSHRAMRQGNAATIAIDEGRQGMADFERLEGKIDSLAAKVESVNVLVASMMPRAEVEAVAARRVSLDTYAADKHGMEERLTRLEASPARLLAWIAVGTGCLGTLISLLMGGFFILEFVLTHYKP